MIDKKKGQQLAVVTIGFCSFYLQTDGWTQEQIISIINASFVDELKPSGFLRILEEIFDKLNIQNPTLNVEKEEQ